jgi:hypothetical protein
MPKSDFPTEYLVGLEKNHKDKVERALDTTEKLLMYSGARLNWVGEYVNDESVHWRLQTIPVDNLTLTGTSPEWNAVILGKAEAEYAERVLGEAFTVKMHFHHPVQGL